LRRRGAHAGNRSSARRASVSSLIGSASDVA